MPHFYFTRRAFLDLEEIYQYSIECWGERLTQTYIKNLYESFQYAADHPTIGRHRQYRSYPYLMAPAEKHYIVYETIGTDIVIAAIIHSKRDIETLVKKLGPDLAAEILQIRNRIEKRTDSDS